MLTACETPMIVWERKAAPLLLLAFSLSLYAGEKPITGTLPLTVEETTTETLPNGQTMLVATARAPNASIFTLKCSTTEGRKHCAPLVPGFVQFEIHSEPGEKGKQKAATITPPGQQLHYFVVGVKKKAD